MSKTPFFFLFLIPLVLVPSIYIDYEKSHSYCHIHGGTEKFCGDYKSVVEYVRASGYCYSESRVLCLIYNPHNYYFEVLPGHTYKIIGENLDWPLIFEGMGLIKK